ncbi:DUF3099 domain-containing protein [Gordonia amicalis]|uniref:DUF3099 domain-containing protein n=1 Tax=Gordonia amicalis TaxID=89053 RepID=UPI0002A632C9|nr:DUF3099 domain-containing protein [Gordonia amicalis]MDV7098733.1 DUF3099 domain-containing protein [Gordonia amicalis]MDV7172175.1 DUF3099 domain-containing protein [Gordonia amicalis]NKX78943.1 DUF3099 domain-containing protein [Gordonia amicalis]UOG23414.1 DUF3099 domain-containing protein [Gordonia amicalis]GAC53439.1 hypothetical protein GOAMI_19_00820 [Gordonia amicalis NBRC 100051 = JCM 11271]
MGANGNEPHGHHEDSKRFGRSEHPAVPAETFLITDAQDSLEAQQKARVRKYLIMMAFRVPALIIAGIAYSLTGSGLLALAIVAVSIPLPWMAVLIANDRPPRKRGEVPLYKYGADHHVVGPPALSRTEQQLPHRTVDGHVVDPDDD